jgi:glycosyltransferase involved in cell wall biosynthesis
MERSLSVVIPAYKRPHLIKRCVEALLKQTLPSDQYEIIVVSDGPDEATARQFADHTFKHIEVTLREIKKVAAVNMPGEDADTFPSLLHS